MATLTVQSVEVTGLNTSYTAASSGLADKFSNDGLTFLHIKNGDVSTKSVIIESKFSPLPKGLTTLNATVELSGTQEKMVGPFEKAIWNDSSGYVNLAWATHTAVTIAVVSMNT